MTPNRSPVEEHVASVLAREDLYFFSRWMFLKRKKYPWARASHHQAICDALMRVYRGETQNLIINIPPRYSKTELAVINFIAWCYGQEPDCEFVHVSYSATLAGGNAAQIRDLIKTSEYQAIFPGTKLASDAGHHWRTTEGGVMYSAGVGGTITGFGSGKEREKFGGATIIDDPHKADEAKSDTIRKGVIDFYQNTLQSRRNSPKRTPTILIMQRLHQDDLAGWLLGGGDGEKWEHLCLSVFNEDGSPLWPLKHEADVLAIMEKANPYVFSGQYRQLPSPPGGGIFKPGQLAPVSAIPADVVEWARGWDLGSTTKGDWTAGPKIGKLRDGRYIIANVVRVQESPDERDKTILNTAKADGVRVKIGYPQDPGQAGKTQVKYAGRELAGYTFITSPESGDKETRAEPFAAQVNVGNVLIYCPEGEIIEGSWQAILRDEMIGFPNGKWDDQIDGCARAFMILLGSSSSLLDYYNQLAKDMADKKARERSKAEATDATIVPSPSPSALAAGMLGR